jgi:hypothetical protein
MAVPNRGTGSCDQAVSALEAALEVCALPSMSMVYLIVTLSVVPST